MALFKITVRRNAIVGGVRLEKGMSVEVPSVGYNPLTYNGGIDVAAAFMRIYGIDLKRLNACNSIYLDVVKIN